MSRTDTADRATETAPRGLGPAAQMVALFGGMLFYAVHLLAGTALVPFACEVAGTWPIHVLSAVALLGIASCSWVAWRIRRTTHDATDQTGLERARFLATMGLLMNALAAAIVLFAEIHAHVFDPCLP